MTVSTDRRTALNAERAELETMLTALTTNYTALAGKNVSEYTFNSGDGSQSAKRMSLSEVRAEMKAVRERIAEIDLELNERCLVRMQSSRW